MRSWLRHWVAGEWCGLAIVVMSVYGVQMHLMRVVLSGLLFGALGLFGVGGQEFSVPLGVALASAAIRAESPSNTRLNRFRSCSCA